MPSPLTVEEQLQTNWCWAACARMAVTAFGGAAVPEQYVLAQQFIDGAVGCEVNGASEACNQPLDAEKIPALYSAFQLVADAITPTPTLASQQVVRAALTAGIVELLLDVGSAFHYILVGAANAVGYSVADPKYSTLLSLTWNDLATAYGNGRIVAAWRIHER